MGAGVEALSAAPASSKRKAPLGVGPAVGAFLRPSVGASLEAQAELLVPTPPPMQQPQLRHAPQRAESVAVQANKSEKAGRRLSLGRFFGRSASNEVCVCVCVRVSQRQSETVTVERQIHETRAKWEVER